jgi:hypothetical protein
MVPYKESHVDVLVCGGGTAGVSAALAAAMNGASIWLIDRNGFFGGTLVSGLVGGFCGLFGAKHSPEDTPEIIVGGTGRMIVDAVAASGGLSGLSSSPLFNSYRYDSCILQIVLDRLLLKYGVRPSLHTQIIDAEARGGRVEYVETANKSGRERIFPKIVVDATGDADIVFMTGGAYRKNVSELQPASFNFRVGGVDGSETIPDLPSLAREIARIKQLEPELKFSREDPMFLQAPEFGKETVCAFSRIPVDGTDADALTMAEIKGRAEVLPTFEFIRAHFPAFRNAHISALATHIGIRETRVIEGEDMLSREDVISGRLRPLDGIGRCAWPIEQHISGQPKSKLIPVSGGDYYELPFGMLLPRGYRNLLVAGRSASADREANASARVFGPCSVMGQAAGTAAAMFTALGLDDVRNTDLANLRDRLRENGALI